MSVQGQLTKQGQLTGDEFLESIRDGREIWFRGERVEDVTTHPAFRNAARSVAKLYDALHDETLGPKLTVVSDTGSGIRTHAAYRAARTAEDLLKQRDAIADWSRLSYGWLGRSPDYKAGFTSALGPNAEFYGDFADNARRWYNEAQDRNLFLNHTIVNPPVDRHKEVHEIDDVVVHVIEERDGGIVVNGAKMVATGSALTHATVVFHYGQQVVKSDDYALAFFVPMNAPGLKLICRPSYEYASATLGSPFDYPLSSRFDENDAVLVLDHVFIPWEDVLVYRDPERLAAMPKTGYPKNFLMQGCTRLAVKLDFLAGAFMKAVDTTGTSAFRGVQASVGEFLAWRDAFWALSTAMASDPDPGPGGSVLPNGRTATAYRVLAQSMMPRLIDLITTQVGGSLICHPSQADWKSDELRPYIDRFYRGSNGYDAESKMKLTKLLWDAVGTEFGGRHNLYERNYFGNQELIRLDQYNSAFADGTADALKGLVDECMSEYDLNGWRSDRYV
jgi:4-hydroxyphenylacetate 3-monooxygenase